MQARNWPPGSIGRSTAGLGSSAATNSTWRRSRPRSTRSPARKNARSLQGGSGKPWSSTPKPKRITSSSARGNGNRRNANRHRQSLPVSSSAATPLNTNPHCRRGYPRRQAPESTPLRPIDESEGHAPWYDEGGEGRQLTQERRWVFDLDRARHPRRHLSSTGPDDQTVSTRGP